MIYYLYGSVIFVFLEIKGVRSCFLPFLSNGLEFSHGGNQHESSLVSSEQDSVKKQDLTLKVATGFKVAGDIGFAVETALAPSVGNFVPKLMSSMVENRLAPLVSHKIINESVGKLGAQATDGLSGIMMNSGGN